MRLASNASESPPKSTGQVQLLVRHHPVETQTTATSYPQHLLLMHCPPRIQASEQVLTHPYCLDERERRFEERKLRRQQTSAALCWLRARNPSRALPRVSLP